MILELEQEAGHRNFKSDFLFFSLCFVFFLKKEKKAFYTMFLSQSFVSCLKTESQYMERLCM